MKNFYIFKSPPKKIILFGVCVLCLSMLLPAQHLYVQPIGGGGQVAFSIADKPKITFDDGAMTVETHGRASLQTQSFALDTIQNLSFKPNQNPPSNVVANLVEKIQIYPNPVNYELTITNYEWKTGDDVVLFDMNGKRVLSAQSNVINMQNFRTGTYILYINQNDKFIQSFKIIKQ